MDNGIDLKSPELMMLSNNKEGGYRYRERRQQEWRENYTLYRDRVTTNRLTQRQSVNVPLMKKVIKTLLKDIDDMPVLYFENLDNDKEKEIFINEYWKWTLEKNNSEIKDIVDKRNGLFYGRPFDQWQIVDGRIVWNNVSPEDILVDRYCDPTDLNTSRFLIHTHIFKTLSYLERQKDYDQEAVKRLKTWYASEQGLLKQADNQKSLVEKNKKMEDMGDDTINDPILGETYVELSLHFVYRADEKDSEGKSIPEQLFLYVEADGQEILMKKPLEEVIGVTKDHYWRDHYPYGTWADDVDKDDFWTDAVADTVRTPNKVANSWWSQIVENRQLRNYNMHYYDSTKEGYSPTSFNPVPWGWYPYPGNPNDGIKDVVVNDLSESLDEMKFLVDMVDTTTGATATQQGAPTERQVTLGEIKLSLTEAKERVKGMSKFYVPAWKKRGEIFLKLLEAAPDKIDAVKVYKKGRNTDNIYSREISPKDWMSEQGYQVKIWSQAEKDNTDTQTLQKQAAVRGTLMGNPVVEDTYKRNLLTFAGYTPEQINDAMDFEKNRQSMPVPGVVTPAGQGGTAPPQPNMIPDGSMLR